MLRLASRPLGLTTIAFGAAIMLLTTSPARADPCEGRLPSRPGQQFSGLVRYVGDGDGFCVGNSADPNTWIEVRLADFNAPELHSPEGGRAKRLLERVAFGRNTRCEARRGRGGRVISHDRVIAVCRVDGRSVGDILRELNAPGPSALFAGRVLPFDEKAGLVWARLMADGTAAGQANTAISSMSRDSLVERTQTAGIEAIVLSPTLGDFNEDLRTLGIGALRAAIRQQLAPEDVARFLTLAA